MNWIRYSVGIFAICMLAFFSGSSNAASPTVCITDLENIGESAKNYWIGPFVGDAIEKHLSLFPDIKPIRRTFESDGEDCAADADFSINGSFTEQAGGLLDIKLRCSTKNAPAYSEELGFHSSASELYSDLADMSHFFIDCFGATCPESQFERIDRLPANFAEAIPAYGKAMASPPHSPERGVWLLKSISRDPSYSHALYELGKHYIEIGHPAEAVVVFAKLADVNPHYPHLWYNLGLAHRAIGHYPQAIAMYKKALEVEPEDSDVWNNLGAAYHMTEMFDKAIDAFEQALAMDPSNKSVEANLLAASRARARKERKAADHASAVEMVVRHIETGAAFYLSGDHIRAEEEFRNALEIDPMNFKANNNIALIYLELSQTEKARAHLERALQSDPSATDIEKLLARLPPKPDPEPPPRSEELEDSPAPADKPEDGRSASPARAMALEAAGRVYLARGSHALAVDAYTRALRQAPGNIDSVIGLGLAYFGLGEYENAHDQFLHALDIEPYNEAAIILYTESEYVLAPKYDAGAQGDEAGPDASSLVEARACLIRANRLSEQGRFSEAAGQYLRALDFAPANADALNNLAYAYHMLGKHDGAREALQKARLLEPGNVLIERNLKTLGSTSKPAENADPPPLELFMPASEMDKRLPSGIAP